MKFSGIGGQAVLEGIMMRNGEQYAVCVRKPDGTIETTVEKIVPFSKKHPWAAWPFIRGTVSLVESLRTGMKTLMWSASFEEDENGEQIELKKSEEVWTVIENLINTGSPSDTESRDAAEKQIDLENQPL